MKVLQIDVMCGTSSTGRIAAGIADVLSKSGDECRIAYGRGNVPDPAKKYAHLIGNKPDVYAHALYSRLFDGCGLGSRKATKNLIAWIKEYDPDIIQLHDLHGYYIDIVTLFEYLADAGKPVVWTQHDCWAFTGHCAHFDYAGCNRWRTGCFECPQKKEYPASIFSDASRRNYLLKKQLFCSVPNMTLVTPSAWLAGLVKESFLQKYPVKVIPNGIDLNVFRQTENDLRESFGIGEKKLILGVASPWSKHKGLDDFIELAKKLPDSCQIVLIGLSHKQKESLPDNIIGLERTENVKELAKWYTAADVFVNPSKEETMGLTTVEAMACGTPAIVYNATAVPESVTYGCGRVVEKGNVDALQREITKIEKNAYYHSCLKNALRYDMNARFFDYRELYSQIINAHE